MFLFSMGRPKGFTVYFDNVFITNLASVITIYKPLQVVYMLDDSSFARSEGKKWRIHVTRFYVPT